MALLEVNGITVRFGGHIALSGVDLSVNAGSITGLIGPNGAGKTTLFNVVMGLQASSSGRVVLDGQDVSSRKPFERARLGMARTFQRIELFGALTVRENIELAAGVGRRRAGRRRSRDQVADRIMDLLALPGIADRRADTIPTGQARVIELARALATQPRLLLLDEPAAGQDAEETRRFGEVLRELANDDMAILLVEHDMSLVMDVCAHIHVLDFGQTLATGSPEEVRDDPAVRRAYLGPAAR